MHESIWIVLLTSTLVSASVGALVSGFFSLRAKREEYANEYYKLVLTRRVQAYEEVERFILSIKTCVHDKDDGRLYHWVFCLDEDEIFRKLTGVMLQALWLSDELFQKSRELNLMLLAKQNTTDWVSFGKSNYLEIGQLRTELEKIHIKDMLVLHQVPQFLKSKKPTDTYTQIDSSGRVVD